MNRKVYALLIIVIVFISCSDNYEQKVYDRMDTYLNAIRSDMDDIAVEQPDNSKMTFKELVEERNKSAFLTYYDLVKDEETAVELAEIYYRSDVGAFFPDDDSFARYKPYYVKKYKNIWVVYGCINLKKAVKKNWTNYGEWYEKLIFIDGNDGKLLLIW